ncbi:MULTISPECIES: IclR family transcriptional regulator [Ramlibacter]|uniref:Helix-turn-helix domain-containing protein n=1 Tax=Ramlibacter pinisoli TaxID=2682844 RepID=A0A6N8IT28_9BURK|nr:MULTISPECIES: IclR family transcriptional regulator [Ramlibacter]MBA2965023.1 IclR family transcriptional regulator [Ramlibacter sp. CGMCC 1.13660]MVQ29988.1 helix-turn-helix domain-containing protein [Ramlibacter pinisoli]
MSKTPAGSKVRQAQDPAQKHVRGSATRETKGTGTNGNRVTGVERALALLRHVATRRTPANLTELASEEGLSGSVTYKLLQALVAQDLVRHDPDRKTYGPGLGMYNLASAILHGATFMDVARANMRELVARTGESACLNLLDAPHDAFMVSAVEECGEPLQYVLRMGELLPLHAGASGKSILAFQPPAVIRRVLSRKLEKVTTGTVVDSATLREQLESIRRAGHCVSYGERLEGAVGIAAPILDHASRSIGSVQLTVPKVRFDRAALPRFLPAVMETARHISAAAQSLQGAH